ncbi:violaxanthin de-epoxidase, chloroplastic [Tanacetum coccineum]
MVSNCGRQVLNCLLDPNCRKALQCLNQCSPVDQVCNYQCLASYESPTLERIIPCVLQKHNCLDLDAKIPEKPFVPPMVKFQDKILSHEIAEDLFVGWLGNLDWSWRVVAGQNPAYDQFPCQYQLFYRGKAKGSFWYEPVFQVKTLDGKLVWRRRKYRVKRGKVAGTFYFSVLDNGVVSNEYWTIVDVSEDFSWGLFHYSGAARVAGQSYTGAVLVSPNGEYPNETEKQRLVSALDRCCIKEWELFDVDNCECSGPPLGLPEGSRLHTTHGGSKQVGFKQLGSKQVGFKQLGHKQVGFKQLGLGVETGFHGVQDEKCVWFEVELQGAQGHREAVVFHVSNDDAAVAQRWLEDKQLEKRQTQTAWKIPRTCSSVVYWLRISSGSYAAGGIYHGRPLVHMLIGLIGSIPLD